MGLLDALKLPSPPKVTTGGAAADLKDALKSAVKAAGEVTDPQAKKRYAAAIAAFDRQAQAIERMPDATRKAVASAAALRDLETARAEALRGGPGPARQAVDRIRPALEDSHRRAAEAHEKLLARQKALAAELAEARATVRDEAPQRRLAQLQAANDAEVEAAGKLRDRLYRDLETLGKDDASDAELSAVVARSDPKANVAAVTTLERDDGLLKRKATVTTTGVANGKADVRRSTTEVGLGAQGLAGSRRDEHEKTSAEGTSKRSQEVSGSVSAKGAAVDATTSSSFTDKDGNTIGVERKAGVQLGPKGAEVSGGKTVTKRDGSSTAVEAKAGVTRGDGEAAVGGSVSTTTTDAKGTADTVSGERKAGLKAGPDGYGGFAESSTSARREQANGASLGGTYTVGGAVTCKVVEPKEEGGLYALTITVDFKAGIALDGGFSKLGPKDGPKGKVAFTAAAKAAKTWVSTRSLSRAQTDAYLKAMDQAAKGGKVDATLAELQTLQLGAQEGWVKAWEVHAKGGSAVGDTKGDSVTDSESVDGEIGVSGSFKAFSVEGKRKAGSKSSTTMTRNAEGGLDVQTRKEASSGQAFGLGVDAGAAGVSFGHGSELKTSVGYLVTLDAKDDPDGKLLAAFRACGTPAAQKAFIEKHRDRLKLKSVTTGKVLGRSDTVEFTLGPADLKLGTSASLNESEERDAEGKLKKSATVGTRTAGGSAGIGGFLRASDETEDTATGESDADGQGTFSGERKRTSSSLQRKLEQKLGLDGKEKPKTGALTDLTGGAEAEGTDIETVEGLEFTAADLAKVVERAKDARDWSDLAWGIGGGTETVLAWGALGKRIVAIGPSKPGEIAKAMAAFVGQDKGRRMEPVIRLSRGWSGAVGSRTEFPESLKGDRKDYDAVVGKGDPSAAAEIARTRGVPEAVAHAQAQLQTLTRLRVRVIGAEDFRSPTTKADMLAAINERRQGWEDQIAALQGQAAGGGDQAAYRKLRAQVELYPGLAAPLVKVLEGKLNREKRYYAKDYDVVLPALKELNELGDSWRREFGKLAAAAKTAGAPGAEWQKLEPPADLSERFRKILP